MASVQVRSLWITIEQVKIAHGTIVLCLEGGNTAWSTLNLSPWCFPFEIVAADKGRDRWNGSMDLHFIQRNRNVELCT